MTQICLIYTVKICLICVIRVPSKRHLHDLTGVKGKAITPFLLAAIEKFTGGRSLKANIELVLSNARLGGVKMANLTR